jgi:plastocyanin
MPRLMLALTTLATMALVGMAGTASAQASPTTWKVWAGFAATETGRPPADPQEILVLSNDFQPRPLEIHVGDTVEFQNGGFHTVTLGRDRLPPFDPSTGAPNPEVAFPRGGNTFDGTGVVQSGILEGPATFPVTFTQPGEYRVLCDIHEQALPGVGMAMTVNVKPAGAPLAMTPEQANAAANAHFLGDFATRAMPEIAQGSRVEAAEAAPGVPLLGVTAGFGDGHVEGVRFLPQSLVVKAGDWVKWTNPDPDSPHTVTLLPGGGLPDPTAPPPADVNPFAPAGGDVYDGTNFVSVPVVANPKFQPEGVGDSGMIRFTSPGEYTFFCLLHQGLGMKGTITVLS